MRYLILSDIHANWEALAAVLDAAGKDGYDEILCCGDLVGYGADPDPVTEWVRQNVKSAIRGNHDKACAGLDDLEWFNPVAKASALWTMEKMSPANVAYLRGLPRGPRPVSTFQILHGSPVDEDEYLIQASEAAQMVGYLDTRVSFFGHTHVQGGFGFHRYGVKHLRRPGGPGDSGREELRIDADSYYLINPGSVGQPRDGDPRAAWCLYVPDENLVVYRRVAYDIAATQAKIRGAGLPELLARRLSIGQ